MAPKFGTSGLRGLVVELTPELVADYTRAFLAACETGGGVYVGWDLRPSSPTIADAVVAAIADAGLDATVVGAVPTPALALASMQAGQAAVMITGSHIPADRNGLKFYVPSGEISKADETAILAARGRPAQGLSGAITKAAVADAYVQRYISAFGARALSGLRIGVYQHSSVARDVMVDVVKGLGGEAVPLGFSDTFIPVDTEAVDPDTRAMLSGWCAEHELDAVISTDGDADRPMVTDSAGRIVLGDVLGPLTAQHLGAEVIVTPVSSNSLVGQMGFARVERTRIGSPFVIAGMEAEAGKIIGYEANGGLLLGFEATGPEGTLAPLMTRDSILPIVAPLAMAKASGHALADLVASLPPRYTAADRIAGIDSAVSQTFLAGLKQDAAARAAFFEGVGVETSVDTTDGLRVTFGEDVVHLRPSGNAPEFRCYAEAASIERAETLLKLHLGKLATDLGSD